MIELVTLGRGVARIEVPATTIDAREVSRGGVGIEDLRFWFGDRVSTLP